MNCVRSRFFLWSRATTARGWLPARGLDWALSGRDYLPRGQIWHLIMFAASSKRLEPLGYARGFSKNNRTTAVRRLSSMYLANLLLVNKK